MEEKLNHLVTYHAEFRTAIFLSSLTLGTFLFTMKSFIVSTMKADVYDQEDYQELVRQRRKGGMDEEYYGPLKSFSKFITWSIVVAILNAFCQITLGYLNTPTAAAACFTSTVISWCLVGFVLHKVSSNLQTMIDRAEERAVKKLENKAP